MLILVLLAALAAQAYALQALNAINQAQAACQQFYSMLPGKVAFDPENPLARSSSASLPALYNSTRTSYWDAANSDDYPACMVFPSCAEEVSAVVRALDSFPDAPFALKSGGHNWNRGYSSTDGGILI